MKVVLRTLLAILGILGLVVVGVVVYVTTFLDPNDLKPRLVQVVREESGLELSLDGPLSWSFYPRLGVSVTDARAYLPKQPEDDLPFAAFDKAEISLAFASLLSGDLAIQGLTLDGMRLNLLRGPRGKGNWEVLLERLDDPEDAMQPEPGDATGGEGNGEEPGSSVAVDLDIASVQVTNGTVRYRDFQQGHELRIDKFNATGTNVNPTKSFPVKSTFQLLDYDGTGKAAAGEPPSLTSDVSLNGRVKLGLDDGRYLVNDLALDAETQLATLAKQPQQLKLRIKELEADPGIQQYRLKGGDLDVGITHPALGEKPMPLSLSFDAEADLAEQEAQLQEWRLTGENSLQLSGSLSAQGPWDSPNYEGQVELASLSLRKWLERFTKLPPMADDDALKEVAFTSPFEGNLDQVMLNNLTLLIDDTTLTGQMTAGLSGNLLHFDLQGDDLDVDRYLPPAIAESSDPKTALLKLFGLAPAWAIGAEEASLLPVDWLAVLNLDGKLSLGQFTLAGLALEDVDMALKGSDGRLALERLASRFYDGELSASGGLDLRQEPVRWRLAPVLKQVDIEALIESQQEQPSPLRGRLALDGEVTTQGNALSRMKRNLNGRLKMNIQDGAMLDTNISQELCTAVAMLDGEKTQREWSNDTQFDRAQATLDIRDGVIFNDDLAISIPGIALGGKGQLDLTSSRFSYQAAARFVDTADVVCKVNPRLTKVPLPVACEGELGGDTSEWCHFDQKAFAKAVGELAKDEVTKKAKEKVEGRLGEALEGLDERLGKETPGELRDKIRGLFQ
ncbi:AsmA family protein [Pistricoccus aurantiacus]|uniref:AsmA family protein n=1 Tax=Pistricoccus aurantiacus TaxID=1883414 RepID=A0A5B8SN89_9GAMM|nr:AsmA family protein [Pistricoccus aurantiacus]QEA38602.1 AsmA family protein [Pistricoccus aurantiacus]